MNANSRPLASRRRAISGTRDDRRVVIDALQVSPDFSGVGRELIELGLDLSRMGSAQRFEVRCAKDMEPRFRDAFPAGTTFHTPLRSSRPRALRVLYQQLVAPLRDDSDTVLICIGDQAPMWGRVRLVYVLNDVRRLTHPHTAASVVERLYYRVVVARASKRADRLLTISEFSRGEIMRVLRPAGPVDVIAIHPGATHANGSRSAEGERLLAVGALRRYKGLETVIDALASLRREGGEVPEVVFVGGSEDGGRLEGELRARAAQAGVADRLTFTGWIEDSELDRLYADAAATVNPSTYEGYGLSVAESLARGLPTIASDIPSHREIADDGALYVPPRNADALAAAIRDVTADPALRGELAERGRARARLLADGTPSWGQAILQAVDVTGLEPA